MILFTIVEAPDNETISHLSIDLSSRGTVHITTLPAMPTSQLRERLTGPRQIGRLVAILALFAFLLRDCSRPL